MRRVRPTPRSLGSGLAGSNRNYRIVQLDGAGFVMLRSASFFTLRPSRFARLCESLQAIFKMRRPRLLPLKTHVHGENL